jgi:hypothetical protein
LTLLAKSNYSIPENSGVLVDSPILDDTAPSATLYYSDADKSGRFTLLNEDGTTSIVDCST